MKILVLGGTGAMGVPVVQILADRGHDVYVTTRKDRGSENPHIHYIIGDAKDDEFLKNLFEQKFNVLIDYMQYESKVFKERIPILLDNVSQYFFFSSSRVYADTGNDLIKETSPRLLDTIKDEDYLQTDEYALAKAREEDMLTASGYSNWTIIRPYITYNDERLQLGVFEKEIWLQRVLNGKTLVFQKDVASKYTTLTYGYDVSLRVADLVGKEEALGEIFHITTDRYIRWADVLEIYLNTLEKLNGKRPDVCWIENSEKLNRFINEKQLKYDRLYNRKFDNSKMKKVTSEEEPFISPEEGLSYCIENFVNGKLHFTNRNWRAEGAMDRITGEKTKIFSIPGWKNKIKYTLYRYIKKV